MFGNGTGCLQRTGSSLRNQCGGNTTWQAMLWLAKAWTRKDRTGRAWAVYSGEHLLGAHRWQHQLVCPGEARKGKAGRCEGRLQRDGFR